MLVIDATRGTNASQPTIGTLVDRVHRELADEEKMRRLTATLREQQTEGARLDAAIAANLKELGYGG